MKCPFCRADDDRVIDSRSHDDGYVIRRRRQCSECERRFTTYERVAELDVRVIKKDGTREPYNPEKIRRGIELACWKRPVRTDRVEQIIGEVLQEIYLLGEPEVESRQIGEMVMDKLSDLDQVAYIHFASVYREFKDLNDFVDEVSPMLNRQRKCRESQSR
jgi:transcriptional repressor NrdR